MVDDTILSWPYMLFLRREILKIVFEVMRVCFVLCLCMGSDIGRYDMRRGLDMKRVLKCVIT